MLEETVFINNEEISVYNPLISSPNKEINLMDKDINNSLNYDDPSDLINYDLYSFYSIVK